MSHGSVDKGTCCQSWQPEVQPWPSKFSPFSCWWGNRCDKGIQPSRCYTFCHSSGLGLVGQACDSSYSGGGKSQCLRGPRFSLQDPYGGSQLPVNSTSRGFSPLSDLCRHQAHMWCTYLTCRRKNDCWWRGQCGFTVKCLSEMSSNRFMYLNPWSPAGSTVFKRLLIL